MLKKRRPGEEKILRCLAERYIEKKNNRLVEEEAESTSVEGNWDLFHDESLYPSKISYLTEAIRVQLPKSRLERKPSEALKGNFCAFAKA
jgi:hypothetical protein